MSVFIKKGCQPIRKPPDDKSEFWVGRAAVAGKNNPCRLLRQPLSNRMDLRETFIIPGILAAAMLLGAGYGVWIYNRLVALQNQMREAWSGVDVQLKRRHDLVPNLVECVKGYRTHEQSVLAAVARERGAAQSAQGVSGTSAAENSLTQNLRALFAVAEAYPDLKADKNFRQLSATLVAVENDIQFARRYYNGSVRDLNNLVQTFPSLLVARGFNFSPAEFFEIETATERTAPAVKL
jgi:LemA protein